MLRLVPGFGESHGYGGGCFGAGVDWFVICAREKIIRQEQHEGAAKRAYRQQLSAPIVAAFFDWCREQCYRNDLLPKSLLAKAIQNARDQETALKVFVDDPPSIKGHCKNGLV